MRKRVIKLLQCPNNHQPGLKLFGASVLRKGVLLKNLVDEQLLDEDEIVDGLVVSESSQTAYPISECIAILLSDSDVDTNHHLPLLQKLDGKCPGIYQLVLTETITKLTRISETSDGKWNREEMKYYDSEVNTDAQRKAMLDNIKNVPVWRIFLPRTKHMISFISDKCKNYNILEIGSGNSRSVSWIFNPSKYFYNYIGIDISFKRLLVAKAAVPEGDFLQASALNLPFLDYSFDAVISFGMLHHLPRPVDAIRKCATLVKKGGYFTFHEPIEKPAFNFPGLNTFKKVMSTYEHSVHDGKIDLDDALKALDENNFTMVNIGKEISIFRAFSETVINKISRKILKSKTLIKIITTFDRPILSTIGKMSKIAGASAVFAVMRKSN